MDVWSSNSFWLSVCWVMNKSHFINLIFILYWFNPESCVASYHLEMIFPGVQSRAIGTWVPWRKSHRRKPLLRWHTLSRNDRFQLCIKALIGESIQYHHSILYLCAGFVVELFFGPSFSIINFSNIKSHFCLLGFRWFRGVSVCYNPKMWRLQWCILFNDGSMRFLQRYAENSITLSLHRDSPLDSVRESGGS